MLIEKKSTTRNAPYLLDNKPANQIIQRLSYSLVNQVAEVVKKLPANRSYYSAISSIFIFSITKEPEEQKGNF